MIFIDNLVLNVSIVNCNNINFNQQSQSITNDMMSLIIGKDLCNLFMLILFYKENQKESQNLILC